MFQTFPNPEQQKADKKAQEEIINTLSGEKTIHDLQFIIGCFLEEMTGLCFSENFCVQMVSITGDIPKSRILEIFEQSKKIYNCR